ncbi:hypothetical protein HDV05_003214, partial [Chytridiales sp. JEL 0842]
DFSQNGTSVINVWYPGIDGVKTQLVECAVDYISEKQVQGLNVAVNVTLVGWGGVVSTPMTDEDHPDVIMLGTTQLAARTSTGDVKSLNNRLAQQTSQDANVLTDDFLRYFFYDGNQNGNWFAIPLVSDYRMLYFNRTVFDMLNLTYPPPLGNWSQPYSESWTWEKFTEYALTIKNSGLGFGFEFYPTWDEEAKLILNVAQDSGASLVSRTTIDNPNMPGKETSFYQNGLNKTSFIESFRKTIYKMFIVDKSAKLFLNEFDPAFVDWRDKPFSSSDLIDYGQMFNGDSKYEP